MYTSQISEDYTCITCGETFYSPVHVQVNYLVYIDRREHVLEHGGHQLDVHALNAKIIQH